MVSRKLLMFGPLPIRILAGITFMAHGLPKLLTVPGRISLEYDILKREIFPRGKSITQKQRKDVERV
jgi:hypothetical protein